MAHAVGDYLTAFFAGHFAVHHQFAGIDSKELGGFFFQTKALVKGIHLPLKGFFVFISGIVAGHHEYR